MMPDRYDRDECSDIVLKALGRIAKALEEIAAATGRVEAEMMRMSVEADRNAVPLGRFGWALIGALIGYGVALLVLGLA